MILQVACLYGQDLIISASQRLILFLQSGLILVLSILQDFRKDAYYLYQSMFTNKNVLHIFPHWNWPKHSFGEDRTMTIILRAYYNHADEVELLINGKSQGVKKKTGIDLHVMWRVIYEPGTVKAVSRKNGKNNCN